MKISGPIYCWLMQLVIKIYPGSPESGMARKCGHAMRANLLELPQQIRGWRMSRALLNGFAVEEAGLARRSVPQLLPKSMASPSL